MAVITISRQYASGGEDVARRVCNLLGYNYFDREMMARVIQEQGLTDVEVTNFSEETYEGRKLVDAVTEALITTSGLPFVTATDPGSVMTNQHYKNPTMVGAKIAVEFTSVTISALREHGNVVVVGRGGQAVLRGEPDVLHVRIVANPEQRVQTVMEAESLNRNAAVSFIKRRDEATRDYLQRYHNIDWSDLSLYHLTVNTTLLGCSGAAQVIATAAQNLNASAG